MTDITSFKDSCNQKIWDACRYAENCRDVPSFRTYLAYFVHYVNNWGRIYTSAEDMEHDYYLFLRGIMHATGNDYGYCDQAGAWNEGTEEWEQAKALCREGVEE